MEPHVARALEEETVRRSVVPTAPDWDHLRLDRGVLRTPDGDIRVKKIGGGTFAQVYREQDGKDRVFALTDDEVFDKEIAAMVHNDLPENPHVPAVERLGHTRDKTVYAMPHYRAPLRKKDAPEAWEEFKALKECDDYARYTRGLEGYNLNSAVVDCMVNKPVPESLNEALGAMKDWAANYSDQYTFEFSPRNLASDDQWNLVLLDVLFDAEQLRKRRAAKWRRQEQNANLQAAQKKWHGGR